MAVMLRRLGLATLASVLLMPTALALPTPGFNGEEARSVTGRIFPEPLQTNDYVSYFEARAGFDILASENPHLLEVVELGQSVGWDNAMGGHDTFAPFAVVVTNRDSTVPLSQRVNLLFMLSIHGNEKGGREGGFRVVEDFVKGFNAEDDVGMASPERVAALDWMQLVFLFPNPDGWTHEEPQYRHNSAGYLAAGPVETQNFVRVNGNGVDLNRQAPTQGWSRAETSESHKTLSQPESQGYLPWLQHNFTKIHFATDIHGMLHPADATINSSEPVECLPFEWPDPVPDPGVPFVGQIEDACIREGHFLLTLLPAGRFTALEEVQITGLSELLEDRINSDPFYVEYSNLPEAGVWGGEFNSWGTVWDTIGYVDSGFSGDYFAQDIGLDAPGMDFEMAYNHVVFDNYYPGPAARINDFHVHTVREIVAAFVDYAAAQIKVSIDTHGTRTAWVPTSVVATNLDDDDALGGWAAENAADDAYDLGHVPFTATINDYVKDLKPFLAGPDLTPAILDEYRAQDLPAADLSAYDNLVVPGSAVDDVRRTPGAVAAVKAFVEQGGNLLLTDSAVQMLADIGVLDADAIGDGTVYAGYANFEDREHALAANVRGLARQLVEPMPLGFEEGENLPQWSIAREAFEGAGGETVGVSGPERVVIGQIPAGEGTVTVIGSLLPDPTEEYYHPYGLASYATTYTGNQLVRNALGWELTFQAPPRVIVGGTVQNTGSEPGTGSASDEDDNGSPAPSWPVAVLALSVIALGLARRRRR